MTYSTYHRSKLKHKQGPHICTFKGRVSRPVSLARIRNKFRDHTGGRVTQTVSWTHRVRSGPAGSPWAESGMVSESLRRKARPTRPGTAAGSWSRSPPSAAHHRSAFALRCRGLLSSRRQPCWLFTAGDQTLLLYCALQLRSRPPPCVWEGKSSGSSSKNVPTLIWNC